MNTKVVMFVFGTRPEAIKMAPVILELKKHSDMLVPLIVLTGQHKEMLQQVMKVFNLKEDYNLDIMAESQSLSQITTKTIQGLEGVIFREKPDLIVVQGDTSTAFAAGLCAFYNKIPIAHIEAGLRTFDKMSPYPEEVNRKLLSVIADLHFAPTLQSAENLVEEKVPKQTIYCTGNTVIDALYEISARPFDIETLGIPLDPNKKLILVTTHRRESFGDPMKKTCEAIKRLALKYKDQVEVVLPIHKNPIVSSVVNNILGDVSNIHLVEPMDYEPFIHLMKASYIILTDSGGVQEEAPSLGKPVLVLREKTERPEAVMAGTVKLVGMDEELIFQEGEKLLTNKEEYQKMERAINPYGDGKASERIISAILHYFGFTDMKIEEFSPR